MLVDEYYSRSVRIKYALLIYFIIGRSFEFTFPIDSFISIYTTFISNAIESVRHVRSGDEYTRWICKWIKLKQSRIKQSPSVIEIDSSTLSWQNSPFDHIQGDQSGSSWIPAPFKLFRLIKNGWCVCVCEQRSEEKNEIEEWSRAGKSAARLQHSKRRIVSSSKCNNFYIEFFFCFVSMSLLASIIICLCELQKSKMLIKRKRMPKNLDFNQDDRNDTRIKTKWWTRAPVCVRETKSANTTGHHNQITCVNNANGYSALFIFHEYRSELHAKLTRFFFINNKMLSFDSISNTPFHYLQYICLDFFFSLKKKTWDIINHMHFRSNVLSDLIFVP